MNLQIQLFAEQAAEYALLNQSGEHLQSEAEGYATVSIPKEFVEKFSQLLIQECASITLDYKNEQHYQGWLDHQAEILKNFQILEVTNENS